MPDLAAVLVIRYVEPAGRGRWREVLALRWPAPRGRAVWACGVGVAVPVGLTVVALLIGEAAGVYDPGRPWYVSVPAMPVSCILALPRRDGAAPAAEVRAYADLGAGRRCRVIARMAMSSSCAPWVQRPTSLVRASTSASGSVKCLRMRRESTGS